jgi:hypothetical protein
MALATVEDNVSNAMIIIERYFSMPSPDAEDIGKTGRLLAELGAMPNGAVAAAEAVLFERASSQQRRAIVGALGDHVHTKECAELLFRVFQESQKKILDEESARWEEIVRSSAVSGIRRMAARVHLSGGQRIAYKPESTPKVQGLVPYLIYAANDKAEIVRWSALLGLADTRDPLAQAELTNRLKDPSPQIRFYAACLLTEFGDTSVLSELRNYVTEFLEKSPSPGFLDPEMLLASLERITGKSFGQIPNALSNNIAFSGVSKYRELLLKWQSWFENLRQ